MGPVSKSRRTLIQGGLALAGAGLLAGARPLPAWANQGSRVARIGYLARSYIRTPWQYAFLQGLRELGYVEGENLTVEYRWAEEDDARLPDLAVELVQSGVELIVTETVVASEAAKQATSTIPIVQAYGGELIVNGLAESLARPGGNLTGLSSATQTLTIKRLELLRDTLRPGTLVAVIATPSGRLTDIAWDNMVVDARAAGLPLLRFDTGGPVGLDRAYEVVMDARAGALLTLCDALSPARRGGIVDLAIRTRLPVVLESREYVEFGGLMSYGPTTSVLFRRAATYVDKILKGANPAELPIEQPTTFELVVNMKTANALGITLPPSVLLQATEILA
jgi:putative tryptophan/tyrosine transport system substrate-binding protein